MNKISLLIFTTISILFFHSTYIIETNESTAAKEYQYSIHPFAKYDFKQQRDTVFTRKDNYIEVNLATQHATLFSRDASEYKFPISSGSKKVEEGIETREGLFVIQWKEEKQHSVQFDSTLMLNWMSFNGGIGFHALEGKGYYRYLGKKNVSHGCVRVSREDAKYVYEKVEKGTPVLVHKGNNAVKIAFTKDGEEYKHYSYSQNYKLLTKRYQQIYDGDYLISSNEKMLIDEKNVYHSGLPIGDSELIPIRQNLKPVTLWVDNTLPETEKLNEILRGSEKSKLTYNTFLDSRN